MSESVVIDSSGDPSGDFHESLHATTVCEDVGVVVSGDADVVVSKKSNIYVCHFCGRECRNAQALGGHMNVHRQERALAKQLVELRNHQGEKLKKRKTSAATGGVVVAVAASANPPTGECELDHQEEVIAHGGSSASSSSPSSPQSIAIASTLVHPWRSLQRLSSTNHKCLEAVDLELRLGFTPGKFL